MTATNKILKILLPLIILVFSSLIFTGCGSIATPILTLNGYTVSWGVVDGAEGYEVNLNNRVFQTNDTSINIIQDLQQEGIVVVSVRALTNSFFSSSSNYSTPITASVGSSRLNAPQNLSIDISNNIYTLSWDSVANAEMYCVKLVRDNTETTYHYASTTTLNLNSVLSGGGEYTASVFAYSRDLNNYGPSLYSNLVEFAYSTLLETPQNTEASISGNTVHYSWDAVEGARGYNVSILNGETSFTTATSISLDLNLSAGETAFLSVQAVSNDLTYRQNSAFSDMSAVYTTASKSSYVGKMYNLGTTQFDLVADSYAELEAIVHFGLYYRINNICFFDNYSTYSDRDPINALGSYVEIKYVTYNQYISRNSMGMRELTIADYQHTNHPTKVAAGDTEVRQNTAVTPTSYTDTPRASDFDDFKINDRTTTMMVYNSDQLYYAVQNGARPTFPNTTAPAYTAYNAAKDVLREIVDDSMTDYEKTLAIFDWLCYTVKYDYNLVDLTSTNNATIYDYRGFYIEGVLFDNGQAVCDGIAKTFALMCNIEGIDCYKVTGMASGGGHAWDKVRLDLDNDGTGEWYAVDPTWNDHTQIYPNGTYEETLSHNYFLSTDDYLESNDHTETSPLTDVANTSFDYYRYTLYDGTHSLYVANMPELESILLYFENNADLSHIEFKTYLPSSIVINYIDSLNYECVYLDNIYIVY